jgi:uncharacterized protein (DUF427 family)
MKAIWNNQTIAESNDTTVVENNHYFPAESVKVQFLKKSGNQYTCPWKGVCDYYNLEVDGKINEDAAWSYPEPKTLAKNITGMYAFWKGVEIVD